MLTMLLICWIGAMDYAALCTRNETQMVQLNLSYREVWSRDNVELYRSNFTNTVLFYPAGLLGASLLPR